MAYSSGISPQTTFPSGVKSWNTDADPIYFDAAQYDWFDFWP
ncbi:MAG: hypothetical protein U0872_04280 [Planctomycetaceae bacterium]